MAGATGSQGGALSDRVSEADARQHFLNFFPLPQGQGSLRPTSCKGSRWGVPQDADEILSEVALCNAFGWKPSQSASSSTVSPNNVRSPSGLSGSASGWSTEYCSSSSNSLNVSHSGSIDLR